jgi:hypothetical protein
MLNGHNGAFLYCISCFGTLALGKQLSIGGETKHIGHETHTDGEIEHE